MGVGIRLFVEGDYALFTRPELKVERVSYDVMTPSAARGLLEAIYFKPQMRWCIERIHVLKPVRFTSIRRNEVAHRASAATARKAIKAGKGRLGLYADDASVRQQRASLVLKDVAYVIEARIEILDAREADGTRLDKPEAKHLDTFKRRAREGRSFHQPYFGCREFAARFQLLEDGEDPPPSELTEEREHTRDLGLMLHDIDYANGRQPRFFRARLEQGVMNVPAWNSQEVLA